MSFLGSLDASGLRGWASRATSELSRRRAEINALNVFPVPDSDTGSNMAFTMEAALREADQRLPADLAGVAQALAVGSVRGARGNSGLVLSQVLRGVAEMVHDGPLDGQVLADALTLAVRLVSRAIAQPVEGTVITVLRHAAEAAEDAAEDDARLQPVAQAAVEAARIALQNTPSQLPELAAAGVVDAGGAGLVILLEALLATDTPAAVFPAPEASDASWLEVMFYFCGDVDALQTRLETMGNCLVVAPAAEDAATVHIHTTSAGPVIEEAFATGQVSDLRLEVLPDPDEHSLAGEQVRRVIAAAPDGAVAKLFAATGADVIAPGTSAGITRERDIFLTNGTECDTGQCQVVDTGSFVAGLAALSVYEPGNPDTVAMVQAMQEVATAMRVEILEEETSAALQAACRRLLDAGGEQATILSAQPVDSVALGEELGAEVAALQVPGIATEIGVE